MAKLGYREAEGGWTGSLFILGQHVIIDGPSPQNTPLAGAVAVFCDE